MYEMHDAIFAGDIVTHRSVLYKVMKVNPANYKVVDEDGQTWNLRRQSSVRKATPEQAAEFKQPDTPDVTLGIAVRFKDVRRPDQRGVFIIADIKSGTAKLVKLGGGMGMRYYRAVPLHTLKPEDAINNADWS